MCGDICGRNMQREGSGRDSAFAKAALVSSHRSKCFFIALFGSSIMCGLFTSVFMFGPVSNCALREAKQIVIVLVYFSLSFFFFISRLFILPDCF